MNWYRLLVMSLLLGTSMTCRPWDDFAHRYGPSGHIMSIPVYFKKPKETIPTKKVKPTKEEQPTCKEPSNLENSITQLSNVISQLSIQVGNMNTPKIETQEIHHETSNKEVAYVDQNKALENENKQLQQQVSLLKNQLSSLQNTPTNTCKEFLEENIEKTDICQKENTLDISESIFDSISLAITNALVSEINVEEVLINNTNISSDETIALNISQAFITNISQKQQESTTKNIFENKFHVVIDENFFNKTEQAILKNSDSQTIPDSMDHSTIATALANSLIEEINESEHLASRYINKETIRFKNFRHQKYSTNILKKLLHVSRYQTSNKNRLTMPLTLTLE